MEIILSSMSKHDRPTKLILFGSYARGNWVEEWADDGIHYQYQSHFDLLAVMKNGALVRKIERKRSLYARLQQEVSTPVHLIAEDAYDVTRRLSKGMCFYTDIVSKGLFLHEVGEPFFIPPCLDANSVALGRLKSKKAARKQQATVDFEHGFGKAKILMGIVHFCMGKQHYREASFELHQVVECLYDAILLVFSGYKPKTHDIGKLSQRVASVEPLFLCVFPQGTEEERNRFEQLRNAYIHSRYQPQFKVKQDDIEWLVARVQHLHTLTEQLCQAKIARCGR